MRSTSSSSGSWAATCRPATLQKLKAAAAHLKDGSGDAGLDGVLGEIELRVEVEIAKMASPLADPRRPGYSPAMQCIRPPAGRAGQAARTRILLLSMSHGRYISRRASRGAPKRTRERT